MEAIIRDQPLVATEEAHCPLCGPVPATFVFTALDRLHGFSGQFEYRRCHGCDLLYMSPRIPSRQAIDFYPKGYEPHSQQRATSRSSEFGNKLSRHLTTLLKRAIGRIFSWIKGANLPGFVKATLGSHARVLDVGCGSGGYLHDLKVDYGCAVQGVDFAEDAVKFAKSSYGIDVFHGNVEEAPFVSGTYDLITAWWFLEHVGNPEQVLAKMGLLLREGGHCLIAVPNSRSLVARLFKDLWYHLDCPRHYHLWTPSGLRRLMERQGLEIVAMNFDKSPWGLLGSLQYLFFGNNYQPQVRNRVRGNMLLALLLLPLSFVIGICGWSDTMVLYGRKPTS